MTKNLIENGGFETGTFQHWTVQNFGTPANVVHHNRSNQAKMEPGEHSGQLLFTRFDAAPGTFTIELDACAPEAKYHEDPPHPDTHPILFFFVSGFSKDSELIQTDIGTWWLNRDPKRIQYNGNMRPEVVNVEVRFSFPSDPLKVKGPLYVDNVAYTLNAQERKQTCRWSR